MSKFSDLNERVYQEAGGSHFRRDIIRGVLRWLDENPDHVPGRTITHSEYRFYANELEEGNMSVAGLLGRLDFDIIPDPEPTNVEKLKTVLGDLNRGFLGYSLDNLVRTLDEAGVKAPDHD